MERVFLPAEDFRIGRVISRLFAVWFANLSVVTQLAVVLMSPVLAMSLYPLFLPQLAGMDALEQMLPDAGGRYVLTAILNVIAYLIANYLLLASLAQLTVAYLGGERPGFTSCLSVALRSFFPLMLISILHLLGILLGVILLLVPGFILMCMWIVVVPVRAIEGTSIMASFSRSRSLTEGHRGAVFLLILIFLAFALGLDLSVRPLMGVSILSPQLGQITVGFTVAEWFEHVGAYTLAAMLWASIYYELRLVKEGVGAQQMAAAFD